ncbi:MerR family transcriptional regulator [Pseudanabaena galeata UHCC 0370]|uniref:MerR family transcriptional regulator n=1 Tax=Pseudanabaena galeata UHCC 0370 TaxID=3110310 RepID=A0ABU5TLG9_9CYAN|nr:MerR family transcriptional regulator [Pseudanabaena galeata]MEA5479105.1 MerR family transcriptional regulator [Pseudanabaena galeata UHCC 0370]
MLKIGDFSKLSQVTIKALRLYDEMGLLKPISVDRFTAYRFYSASQLPRLNRILAFKDLGFSLEQISQLLNEEISPEQMRGMLRLKQADLQQQIEQEQGRLVRVAARLKQIEQEDVMSNYEVVIKKFEPITVASIREILPNYAAIAKLFQELYQYLAQQGVTKFEYDAGIWHDSGYRESDVDGEAVVSVPTSVKGNDRIKVYELQGYEAIACVVHHGSYSTLNNGYQHLLTWIENNGYRCIGANREFYIQSGAELDNESYITEIQFPIEKI